jgi:tRNA threonylcarbamoyladenosine biosynthesis protein TsaB
MMWVLAVDTSSPGGAVALLRDDDVIVERAGHPGTSHVVQLPGAIADVLAEAALTPKALDLLAVASGPGAFTALRVGLATVQGLAVSLDRPTVGVSSLAAAAWRYFDAHPGAVCCAVWLEGGRGDVFAAAFRRPGDGSGWPLSEAAAPTVATPPATLERWRHVLPADAPLLLGPGGPGRRDAVASGRLVVAGEAPLAVPVARIAWRAHAAGLSGPPHALAPLYVRRPDAEVERDRRLGVGAPSR